MTARRARTQVEWASLPSEELLDQRICDLGLSIRGSDLETRVEKLRNDLQRRGLRFLPYCWLSTAWFTPHGVTGFAIPFYLAHPRLIRLERNQMLEAEGSTQAACTKLLRHEAGHAFDNAYRLHRSKAWREHFGRRSDPYYATYVPRPSSRRYVQHLDHWYAQSHPMEDFAETFAVWLSPRSRWRARYSGWAALRKLEFVEALMGRIAERKPPVRTREHVDSVTGLRLTLREYYRRKKARYGFKDRTLYERDLQWCREYYR